MSNRLAGIIYLKIGGKQRQAAGEFTYNLGGIKREAEVGTSGFAGFKAKPQVAFIEGEIYDSSDLNVKELLDIEDETVTLELYNGKTAVFPNAYYAADGNITTDSAKIQVRFEAKEGNEI